MGFGNLTKVSHICVQKIKLIFCCEQTLNLLLILIKRFVDAVAERAEAQKSTFLEFIHYLIARIEFFNVTN